VNPTVSEIFNAAGLAWRDMHHVFDAIYKMVVIAFLITAVFYMTHALMLPGTSNSAVGYYLDVILTTTVQVFLITPYLIAVHRFIILGEVTTSYQLTPGEPRFLHFFGWWLVILVLIFVPFLLATALPTTVFLLGVRAIVFIVAMIVGMRVIILLPAVAVDAPGASWSRAMADTRGYTWRILFIVLLATLPLAFVRIIVSRLLGDLGIMAVTSVPSGPPLTAQVALAIFNGAIRVIAYTLAVVIASRLYERLGDRVKQPV
jgi:hypothetical protein